MIAAFKILLADSSHFRDLEDKLRIKQNHIRLRDTYIEELEERAESAEEKRDTMAAEVSDGLGQLAGAILNRTLDSGSKQAFAYAESADMVAKFAANLRKDNGNG